MPVLSVPAAPQPLQVLCKSCKSLTTHRQGRGVCHFHVGRFYAFVPRLHQALRLLPGLSPARKKPAHKSALPPGVPPTPPPTCRRLCPRDSPEQGGRHHRGQHWVAAWPRRLLPPAGSGPWQWGSAGLRPRCPLPVGFHLCLFRQVAVHVPSPRGQSEVAGSPVTMPCRFPGAKRTQKVRKGGSVAEA